MINYVLIDDEAANTRTMKKMLDAFCPDACFSGMATSVDEGEKLIRKAQPDLVFLDIQMSHENAFDLLDRMVPVNFEVVFVTAFEDYSLKAFRYCALDYILKPVDINELNAAVRRVAERHRLKELNGQLHHLLANLRQPETTAHKLALPNVDNLVFISVDDILRCEARGGYTLFFLKNKEEILSTKAIGEYEQILPSTFFFRVHHSHIVNLRCIRKYHKGRGGLIEMEGGTKIEVSARRKTQFLSRFGF
jgi:two-component system LytT family response regulator